jgi:hypothetical protein
VQGSTRTKMSVWRYRRARPAEGMQTALSRENLSASTADLLVHWAVAAHKKWRNGAMQSGSMS